MPNSTETSLKPSGTKSFRVMRLKLNVCHLERSQQGERWKGHHSWCETWWWIADVLGCVSYKGTGYFIRIDGNRNAVSYQKRNFLKLSKFCIHQPGSCKCDVLGHFNMTMMQNRRPSRPVIGYSKIKWHDSLLTSISLSHSEETSNLQFMQDSPRNTGTGGFLPGRMGRFTIWESIEPHPQLSQITSSCHWC